MSIFNRLFGNTSDSAPVASSNGSSATSSSNAAIVVQFTLEEAVVPFVEGMTAGAAVTAAADDLGIEASRVNTIRINGSVSSLNTILKPGDVLTLSINSESKG